VRLNLNRNRQSSIAADLTASAVLLALGLAAVVGSRATAADGTSVDLALYAVEVVKRPGVTWHGYGVYLGQGLVITAAHVVPGHRETGPAIIVAGHSLQGTVIKYGDFESVDLAMVKIDETALPYNVRHLSFLSVCSSDPAAGEQVVVVTPENTAPSHVISADHFSSPATRRFKTLVADVDTTGNSGSGVFDAARGCLLGIMSRKIEEFAIRRQNGVETRQPKMRAKYFVPASWIREFAAPWLGTRYLRR
jgi:hypothetical protein